MTAKGKKNTPEQEAKRSATAKAKNPLSYRPIKGRENGKTSQPEFRPTPENRIRQTTPICGGKRRDGGICCQTAGWGTQHPGVGACKRHGGSVSTHNTKAARETAMQRAIIYGAPINISPDYALLQEVHRTAGHVAWLGAQIAEFEHPAQLSMLTAAGVRPSVILSMYQEERKHLVHVCKAALDSGIQERQIRLIETQANMMVQVLQRFLQHPLMALTPEQRINSREVLRECMEAVDVASMEIPLPPSELLQNVRGYEPMEIIDDSLPTRP